MHQAQIKVILILQILGKHCFRMQNDYANMYDSVKMNLTTNILNFSFIYTLHFAVFVLRKNFMSLFMSKVDSFFKK